MSVSENTGKRAIVNCGFTMSPALLSSSETTGYAFDTAHPSFRLSQGSHQGSKSRQFDSTATTGATGATQNRYQLEVCVSNSARYGVDSHLSGQAALFTGDGPGGIAGTRPLSRNRN
jgi:hypothetical protein